MTKLKKSLITLSLASMALITSSSPVFAADDISELGWDKYPNAWKIEWVAGGDYDCGYLKVYEKYGVSDYVTVQCKDVESDKSIVNTIDLSDIPENILEEYKNAHFIYHESENHYHIYPNDFKGELGIYDCINNQILIEFMIKDYGKEIISSDEHYTEDNRGYINVYFKDGSSVREEALYVEVSENDKTFYVVGNRYKVMEDKLK